MPLTNSTRHLHTILELVHYTRFLPRNIILMENAHVSQLDSLLGEESLPMVLYVLAGDGLTSASKMMGGETGLRRGNLK